MSPKSVAPDAHILARFPAEYSRDDTASPAAACTLLLLIVLFAAGNAAPRSVEHSPPATRPIDFQKEVRPILAGSCYECHGERKQKGGLRLDRKADALHGGDDGPVIVPGDSAASLLVRNVSGVDPDTLMPPAGKGKRLTAEQVGLLRAWIDQGRRWTAPDRSRTRRTSRTTGLTSRLSNPPCRP